MAIAAYLRISVDEEIGKDNTSIENQKSIISAYAAQKFPDDDIEYLRIVTAQATPLSSVRVISTCAEG